MANVTELIKPPKQESTDIMGLPLTQENWTSFCKELLIYLGVHRDKGYLSELPDYIQNKFRTVPNPELGQGFSHARTGRVFAWVMPKVKVGEQYKHIKPPIIPVFNDKDRFDIELQSSIAIRPQQWGENFNNPEVYHQIINTIHGHSRSAIYNTILDWYNYWRLCILSPDRSNVYVFNRGILALFHKKVGDGNEKAKPASAQDLLQNYQVQMKPMYDEVKKRAEKVKNFSWYVTGLREFWPYRQGGEITDKDKEVKHAKKPDSFGNSMKEFIEKFYLQENAGKKYVPTSARVESINALANKIIRTIRKMTLVPNYTNHVALDTGTALASTTKLHPTRCDMSDLVIIINEWDFDDVTALLRTKIDVTGLKFENAAGAAPGTAYVGEEAIINLHLRLNHSPSHFHEREEETQWYTNYWLAGSCFTDMVCGTVIAPCDYFRAPAEFYEEFYPEE